MPPSEAITANVDDFSRLSGITRTGVYAMLDRGELVGVKVGRRRLILLDSYHELIARQLKGEAA